jgi:hypothetical protein
MTATTTTTTITREEFLAMVPETMLKDGFRDSQGRLREEVLSIWATAGAIQLEATSSAELVTTLRALAQTMPLHDQGTASERFSGAVMEAHDLASRIHGRAPTADLGRWLAAFAPLLRSEQDLRDMLQYSSAVARQHAMFAGLKASRQAR